VTTNPTIIAKERRPFRALIEEIRSVLGGDRSLHVQVVSAHADDMVREAEALAAYVGDNFYAPYVDRIANLAIDGAKVVADVVQVNRVSLAGAQAVTVGKDLFKKLIAHPMTDQSIERFTADWEEVYGKDTDSRSAEEVRPADPHG